MMKRPADIGTVHVGLRKINAGLIPNEHAMHHGIKTLYF